MSPNMTISRARPNLLSDKVYMNYNVYRECEQSYGQTPAFFKVEDWSLLARLFSENYDEISSFVYPKFSIVW